MIYNSEYPESFLRRIDGVGSSNITPENSEKYWLEHKANMTWGVQKALGRVLNPKDVAILGAGKCNDIRLLEIMQKGSVENIDLYDLDIESVEMAINYINGRISSILPDAIRFANFNPIFADVTFVMKKLLKKFDGIRYDFTCEEAPVGPDREKLLHDAIMDAVYKVLANRKTPETRYDTVVSDCILSPIVVSVEFQINQLLDDLLAKNEQKPGLWEELLKTINEIFIKDHFDIVADMTRESGSIFIASDNVLLVRGKVHRLHKKMLLALQRKVRDFGDKYIVEEIEVPRFKCMESDILKMVEKYMPEFKVVGAKNWEWNRDPHETQKDDVIFGAEKVQGVVLERV